MKVCKLLLIFPVKVCIAILNFFMIVFKIVVIIIKHMAITSFAILAIPFVLIGIAGIGQIGQCIRGKSKR